MNLIVCVDENYGIGKNGDLLVKIPDDLAFFRKMTVGKTIIMGRKTFFSFPNQKPLKNRKHIILSKTMEQDPFDDVRVVRSPEDVFHSLSSNEKLEDVFVIGGEQIYKEFFPYCKRAYVTKILKSYDADTFFVPIDQYPDWTLFDEGEIKKWEGILYRFLVFEKK